ncbi:hypothetical protein [Chromobacterium vaccinii]|uniref:DUF5983 family protein n=1 Tax=Chromobacterium vaccinii TaxID=1108595 RepID=UPI003458B3ED
MATRISITPELSINHLSLSLRAGIQSDGGDWANGIMAAMYDCGFLIQIEPNDHDQFDAHPELQQLRSWALRTYGPTVYWLQFDDRGPRVDELPYHWPAPALVPDGDRQRTAEQLEAHYSATGCHPTLPHSTWRMEVLAEQTALGYWAWVEKTLWECHGEGEGA